MSPRRYHAAALALCAYCLNGVYPRMVSCGAEELLAPLDLPLPDVCAQVYMADRQGTGDSYVLYRPNRPGMPAVTMLLALLWLLLVGYIIAHPDPIGVIVLVVMAIFIAGPAVFVLIGMWRMRRRLADGTLGGATDGRNGHDIYNGRDAQNGHHVPDANGAQQRKLGEIPEEGGDHP